MTQGDPVGEALSLLRSRETQLDAELGRVRAAITALAGLSSNNSAPAPSTAGARPSVRTMAVSLMEEADRDWSAGEILAEYERRGTPIHGKDPNNALRAAIADAFKVGAIVRTATGRYMAKKWSHPSLDPWATDDSVEEVTT